MRRPLLALALLGLAAFIVASVPLFILYDDDDVATADAVMVLAADKRRLPTAPEFVERGVAHLFRARMLFERCFDGRLAVVGAPKPGWRLPLAISLEWAKLGVATVGRPC